MIIQSKDKKLEKRKSPTCSVTQLFITALTPGRFCEEADIAELLRKYLFLALHCRFKSSGACLEEVIYLRVQPWLTIRVGFGLIIRVAEGAVINYSRGMSTYLADYQTIAAVQVNESYAPGADLSSYGDLRTHIRVHVHTEIRALAVWISKGVIPAALLGFDWWASLGSFRLIAGSLVACK